MAKKQKCPECEEGAPSWLVSYGDMTTLLLCFFVFLLVTAKVDVDKLSAASGVMARRSGVLPDNSGIDKNKTSSEAKDSIKGDEDNRTIIDEGRKPVLGAAEMFREGEAVLIESPEVTMKLMSFARVNAGYMNIIEIRGHATPGEYRVTGIYRDDMELSLERARVVRDYLVRQGKLKENRIRIVGCSYYEQTFSNLLSENEGQNRRVELRVTEKYQDHNPNTRLR